MILLLNFSPDELTMGWLWTTFERLMLKPDDVGRDGNDIVGLRLDEFSVDGDGNIITH